jgi:hypothetical protein
LSTVQVAFPVRATVVGLPTPSSVYVNPASVVPFAVVIVCKRSALLYVLVSVYPVDEGSVV